MKGLVSIGILAALGVAVFLGLQAGAPVAVVTPAKGLPAVSKQAAAANTGSMPEAALLAKPSSGNGGAEVVAPSSGAAPMANAVTPLSGPEQIEQWLSSSTDIPTIVNKILAGFPSLDPKDHLLAVAKLAPLVGDERYERMKLLLVDRNTSLEAKEFLYRDAFNRSAEVKLPTMFAVMTTPGHPQAAEARETLINHLGADYGANQGQWLASIQANLKERAQIGK